MTSFNPFSTSQPLRQDAVESDSDVSLFTPAQVQNPYSSSRDKRLRHCRLRSFGPQ